MRLGISQVSPAYTWLASTPAYPIDLTDRAHGRQCCRNRHADRHHEHRSSLHRYLPPHHGMQQVYTKIAAAPANRPIRLLQGVYSGLNIQVSWETSVIPSPRHKKGKSEA